MKFRLPNDRGRKLTAFVLALGVGARVFAQTAPTPVAASSSSDDETVTLSPFVVSSEKDTGYQATDTLAGTRLRTPLKDIGASISVLTKDLFEDTASRSAVDILVFATGVEAAGINGNYSGSVPLVNQMNFNTERQETNAVNRVRGLAGADTTRNYFGTRIPLDAYNTQSVTVNRGSNSILFGLGSPAGIIENTTLVPTFKNAHKVSVSTDADGSTRESVDLERVLIKNKLSLRIAALNDERNYEQQPAFRDQHRIYGTIEYRPFRGNTIRVNAEKGRLKQNLPRLDPPIDAISEWYAYGKLVRPDTIWHATDAAGNFSAGVPGRINYERLWNLDGTLGQLWNPLLFYADPRRDAVTDAFPSYAYDTSTAIPGINRINYMFLVPRPTWEARRFATRDIKVAPPGDPLADYSTYTQMTDRNVFDYRKYKIDGPNSDTSLDFRSINASVEQLFLNGDAGVEFVIDQQHTQKRVSEIWGAQPAIIKIDVNVQTNDGRPNPNFGRPLLSERGGQNEVITDSMTARGTAYIGHDFRKELKGWLGRVIGQHTVTGFYTDNLEKDFTKSGVMAAFGSTWNNAHGIDLGQDRQIGTAVYIGPSLLGTTSMDQVRLSPITTKLSYPKTVTTWQLGPQIGSQNRAWVQTTQNVYQGFDDWDYLASGVSANRLQVISWGEVWQGRWLDDSLISTLGWRHDEVERYTGANGLNPATNTRYTYLPHTTFQSAATNNSFTQGYALHVPERWMKHLPGDLGFSLYYNDSENFRLAGIRQTIFGEPLGTEQGSTREYGIGLNAFNGKLSLRATRYKTVQDNITDPRVTPGAVLNRIAELEQRIYSTNTLAALKTAGYVGFNDPEAGPLIKRFAEAYNFKLSATPDVNGYNTLTYTVPANVAEVTSGVTEGYEFELTYNPTKNWRIMANAANQESVRGAAAPNAGPLITERVAIWSKPTVKTLVAGTSFDVQSFYTSVLQLPVNRAQHSEGEVVQELVPWRANLVTNYTFDRASKFKGWAIGGAARWQDKIALGYAPYINPSVGVGLPDLDHPFRGADSINYDAWLSYSRLIFNKKVNWKIQLNVKNLLNENLLVPVKANPVSLTDKTNYYVAAYRIGEARTWVLSSTFSF